MNTHQAFIDVPQDQENAESRMASKLMRVAVSIENSKGTASGFTVYVDSLTELDEHISKNYPTHLVVGMTLTYRQKPKEIYM